jgi:hypothetical protein
VAVMGRTQEDASERNQFREKTQVIFQNPMGQRDQTFQSTLSFYVLIPEQPALSWP